MTAPLGTTRALIDALVSSTGASNPVAAIRHKAEQTIDSFVELFGEPEQMPLDLVALASFLGIKLSDVPPSFSPDAELVPDGDGGVEMRVNPDQPDTRKRFSIGHEITHTFFPDHTSHIWPRADSRYRDLSDPDDFLEMLCDIGAAELVFPRRWFLRDAQGVDSAAGIVGLANRYRASKEATVRRFAELHPEAVAAVFFAWKLKPSQKRQAGRAEQTNLPGIEVEAEQRPAVRLRLSYAIPSASYSSTGHFLPRDKSVENHGPLYEAASTGLLVDGEAVLDLGQATGTYRIMAVPIFTSDDDRGPKGEYSVAAVIRPLSVSKSRANRSSSGPSLFD